MVARQAEGKGEQDGFLKISQLAERSGVSVGTIRHYLREGLLGPESEVKRTSRNMAYYPAAFVDRVLLIKRLQQKRFMPLRLIGRLIAEDPERASAMIELEDRIVQSALARREEGTVSAGELRERVGLPANVLERLEQIGILTPSRDGAEVRYEEDDVAILQAISRFRAGGFEEKLGFTVYDVLRYREAFEPLVREEARALLAKLAGEVEAERALEIIASGVEPLRELVGAIHSKLLLAELVRQRDDRRRRADAAEGRERVS